jgi:hypothetical protein
MRGNARSQKIARALHVGARAAGYTSVLRPDDLYRKQRESIVAFYGYQKNLPTIFAETVAAGNRMVFADLGYWCRRHGGRWAGYHKITVGSRHPDAYFMDFNRDRTRLDSFGIVPERWRKGGRHIIVAGMSAKAAESLGMQPEQWERQAVRELRKATDRPIIYRPKPSWNGWSAIPGASLDTAGRPIGEALRGCHAVVTHHSNAAVDALIAGIPAFCESGAAMPLALRDLSRIEKPERPAGREQWLANLAWCQWSVAEMESGAMWRALRTDGLIP